MRALPRFALPLLLLASAMSLDGEPTSTIDVSTGLDEYSIRPTATARTAHGDVTIGTTTIDAHAIADGGAPPACYDGA